MLKAINLICNMCYCILWLNNTFYNITFFHNDTLLTWASISLIHLLSIFWTRKVSLCSLDNFGLQTVAQCVSENVCLFELTKINDQPEVSWHLHKLELQQVQCQHWHHPYPWIQHSLGFHNGQLPSEHAKGKYVKSLWARAAYKVRTS